MKLLIEPLQPGLFPSILNFTGVQHSLSFYFYSRFKLLVFLFNTVSSQSETSVVLFFSPEMLF